MTRKTIADPLRPFDLSPRTRVIFGAGAFEHVGTLAAELGFTRTLVVADQGMLVSGYADRTVRLLQDRGIRATSFNDFGSNPDSRMVEAGRDAASRLDADSIVAVGGGSSLDCAKGINFLLAGGGAMRDYRGYGKARGPMRPSIGIATTAGTGSEAQSYAIISDAETHAKMACGDPGAAFRVAILDPTLTLTQPRAVTAVAGYDAISHAVESYVTTARTPLSVLLAREAWRLLAANYERVLTTPDDVEARGAMLLGSHEAGMAIEQSMLGATHACANPLTARYGTLHGVAIGVMLPHVVRWNAATEGARYADLLDAAGVEVKGDAGEALAARLETLARAGGLPAKLREVGMSRGDLGALAADAATQWTGTFNPRPFDEEAALSLYERAF